MDKTQFIQTLYPLAQRAGKEFNLNPVVILAQAALESGWGTNTLSREHNNYFAICGYGKPNAYWSGRTVQLKVDGLLFRYYLTPEESFLDYARLIRTNYKRAADMSRFPEAFAKEIAYSPYISEANGDNRAAYQKAMTALSNQITAVINSWTTGNQD